jgi:hypothetical protein
LAKQKKHIDDLFKDYLNDSELPLAGNEWDAIAKELHPKKKRFGWWIWLLPAILLSAGIWYAVSYSNQDSAASVNAESDPVENNLPVEKPEATLENERITSTSEFENESSNTEETNSHRETDVNETIGSSFNSSSPTGKTTPAEIITQDGNSAEAPSADIDDGAIADPMIGKELELDPDALESISLSNILNDVPELTSIGLDGIPYDLYRVLKPYNELVPGSKATNKVTLPKEAAGLTNIKVGILASGLSNNQNISANSADIESYKNYRELNESSRITNSYSLLVKANLNSLNVGSGVSYITKGQNMDDLTYQLFDSIPHIIGQDTVDYFYFNYRDTTTNEFSRPTYHYLSIPIQLGKTFYLNPRLSIDASIQSNIGYLISSEGNTLNTGLKPTELNTTNLNKLLIDAGGTIGINYRLNNQFSLQLNSSISKDLTNTLVTPKIKQTFTRYGLGIGVYYHLNK